MVSLMAGLKMGGIVKWRGLKLQGQLFHVPLFLDLDLCSNIYASMISPGPCVAQWLERPLGVREACRVRIWSE